MARAIWNGVVSFGLVTLPVKIVSALRDRRVHLHMLSKDGRCRLRQKLYCPETGEEYDFKQAARGYEVAPDQYVILNEDELGRLEAENGHAIQITDFVDLSEVDPIYFDRAYYLVPDELGTKSYQLLLKAMAERRKVGIGKVVIRNRQYLVALRPMGGDGVIGLETMRYADEVVPTRELDLPEEAEVDAKELELATRLIDALAAKFEPDRYKDEYRERLTELIEKKTEGEEIVTQAPGKATKGEVINLMEALKKSLEQTHARERHSKKKSADRKKA